MKDFSDRIFVGITGSKEEDWKSKLEEINKLRIKKIALFLEIFKEKERKNIYKALLDSCVEEIPLTHIRDDVNRRELLFLNKNFDCNCFNIHESHFRILKKWRSFYKKLYLEMNYDNFVSKQVDVSKVGGFCIDLSHFKVQEKKFSEEFKYIMKRKNIKGYFKCNHLNGYSYERNCDLHTVNSLKDFDYLKELPEFIFSDIISIEVFNCVKEQLKFKKYLTKMLNNKFRKV